LAELLRVEEVSISIDNAAIVRDASLEVDRGEIAVLMGPNGSGKSTLLKAIAGLPGYRVVSGRIMYCGSDITKLEPWNRARMGIALAFQNPPKIYLKVGNLVDKLSKIYGSTDLVNYVVKELGLSQLINRDLYSGFSGGEIKRVELALTILMKPKLALLDEPDSGVDVDSIKRIAMYINRLAEENVGVLIVTHTGYILRYIENLGRGYVMIDGRIVYSAPSYEVVKKIMVSGYGEFNKIGGTN